MGANQSKDELDVISAAEYREVEKLIKEKGIEAVQKQMSEKLESWKEEKIKLCVTGMGGVGKSHFINAFRGYETAVVDDFNKLFFYLHVSCDACSDFNTNSGSRILITISASSVIFIMSFSLK